jgi:hypothetical protein
VQGFLFALCEKKKTRQHIVSAVFVEPSCILVLPGTGSSLLACTCAREREVLGSLPLE